MDQTRRTMLTALPAAVLATGALATQFERAEAQTAASDGLTPLANELQALARQAVKREIPFSEVARRGASGMRLLRSHLLNSGLEAKLHRQVRSPRMREAALAKAGQHLDAHDQFLELGMTPPDASRDELERAVGRWVSEPQWLSRTLGDFATRMDRVAPRLVGELAPGVRVTPVQASGECDWWRVEAGYLQWLQMLICMFAGMNFELQPLCWAVTSLLLMVEALMWSLNC